MFTEFQLKANRAFASLCTIAQEFRLDDLKAEFRRHGGIIHSAEFDKNQAPDDEGNVFISLKLVGNPDENQREYLSSLVERDGFLLA